MVEEKSILERLTEAQNELKAPKNQTNKFGGYNYRSAEDILEAVKPINKKYGLTLYIHDEPLLVGDWHYIKSTATIEYQNDSISVDAYAREAETKKGMDPAQVTGATSSYARKYALNGLYLIDDTKDVDSEHYQGKADNEANNENKLPNQQIDGLIETLNKNFGIDGDGIRKLERIAIEQSGFPNIEEVRKRIPSKYRDILCRQIKKLEKDKKNADKD